MGYAAHEPSFNPARLWISLHRQRTLLLAVALSLAIHLLPLLLHGKGGGRHEQGGAQTLQVMLLNSAQPSRSAPPVLLVAAKAQPQPSSIKHQLPSNPPPLQPPGHKPRPVADADLALPAPPAMFAWHEFGDLGMQYYPWTVLDVLASPQTPPNFFFAHALTAEHYRVHLQLLIDELGNVNSVVIQDMDPAADPDAELVRQVVIRGFLRCHFTPAQIDGRRVRSLIDIDWMADASSDARSSYKVLFDSTASASN